MNEVWTGIFIGALSSFHCIGMCGPIALSLPGPPSNSIFSGLLRSVLYNAGRILTYAFLGLLTGSFGRLFFYSGWQQILSITIGILIISGFILSQKKLQRVNKFLGIQWFTNQLRKGFTAFFNAKSKFNLVLIGILNGFLPCGFVYLAAGNALVIPGGVENAILYMVFFGLGTFPVMFILAFSKSLISLRVRSFVHKAVPFIAIAMGILFILRGLELNIPYVSPLIDFTRGEATESNCQP